MKKVDNYLFTTFLIPFFICAISFIGLFFFVDTAEKLRPFFSYSNSVEKGNWSLALSYISGSVFVYFINFLPFLIAMAGAMAHVSLNKNGQLMALYSFGLNHQRIFRLPILLSFLFGLLVLFLNIQFLPTIVRNVENSSRLIRGLPNKNKAFVHEELISLSDQQDEKNKNIKFLVRFPETLNPPVVQIINFNSMIDENHFKKIQITRLDSNRKIRQRLLLSDCTYEGGFVSGESCLKQDYYANGDLFEETHLTKNNQIFIKVKTSNDQLAEVMSLYSAPNQTSLITLLNNYHMKIARDEIMSRLLGPLKCLLFLLLSLAFSCLLNLKKIYMSFAVLMLVAIIDLIAESIPVVFFANSVSVLPILLTPLFLYLISIMVFRKARI